MSRAPLVALVLVALASCTHDWASLEEMMATADAALATAPDHDASAPPQSDGSGGSDPGPALAPDAGGSGDETVDIDGGVPEADGDAEIDVAPPPSCDGGLSYCAGAGCIDLQTERTHCGTCEKNCGANRVCNAGVCQK